MSHENYDRSDHNEGSSNRSFGLVFAAFFLVVAVAPLFSGGVPRYWGAVVACAFAVTSFVMPSLLTWPNRVWTRLGRLLHMMVNPIILAALFFLIITPYAVVMRIFRKDSLALKRVPGVETYWQKRTRCTQDMKRQF